MAGLVQRFQASRPWRTWLRYGQARGSVLAGGVAYFAFFSVFPILVLGFTAFGLVLAGQDALRAEVFAFLAEQLPGVLGAGGVVEDPDDLVQRDLLSVTGLVALGGLLFTGLGWLDACRQGIRAVFEQPADVGNLLLVKLKDLGVLATIGLAVLASVLLSVVVSATAGVLLDLLGLEGSAAGAALLRVLAVLVSLLADMAVFLVLFRLLSGLRVPWADLRQGALVGAIALGVLKLSAGLLLRTTSDNRFFAAAAVFIGLLVWMNFVARVVLLAAAWAATTAADRGSLGPASERAQAQARARVPAGALPAPAVADVPAGPRDVLLPSFGQRSADRTAVAAGAVLGATAVLAARVLGGAVRALGRPEDD